MGGGARYYAWFFAAPICPERNASRRGLMGYGNRIDRLVHVAEKGVYSGASDKFRQVFRGQSLNVLALLLIIPLTATL